MTFVAGVSGNKGVCDGVEGFGANAKIVTRSSSKINTFCTVPAWVGTAWDEKLTVLPFVFERTVAGVVTKVLKISANSIVLTWT